MSVSKKIYSLVMSHNIHWYHMLLCAALVFYTLLLQLSTCIVKSHIELHLEYTSTILSSLVQTACLVRYYLKYTAVLLACKLKYTSSILMRTKKGSMH